MRALKRKLILAALTRPDAVFYWLQAVVRLSENRAHSKIAREFQDFATDARDACVRLGFAYAIDSAETEEVRSLYRTLREDVDRLYGEGGRGRPPSVITLHDAETIYSLVRISSPRAVVETGVSDGMSSFFILLAMCRNGRGLLDSIDFPLVGLPRAYAVQPGWLVPRELRNRWHLHYGKSEKLLEPLLRAHGQIDAFLHDSEHSHRRMALEFDLASRYLRPGGFILSDDALANDAFLSLVRSHSENGWAITKDGFGVARIGRS